MVESSPQQIRAFALGMKISGNLSSTAGIWAFTIVMNIAAGGFCYLMALERKPPSLWVFCVFIAMGLLPLALATYVTISRFRYGWPVLEFQTFASVPGGVLTGTIRIPKPLVYREGIHLSLACMRGVVRRGLGNDPVEMLSVLWEDRCILDRFSPDATVGQIPVFFKIPSRAKPSEDVQAGSRILWRLDVKAKTAGVPCFMSFIVPVLAGPLSPEARNLPDVTAALRSPPQPARQAPADRRIQLRVLADGGCQCEFAAGRNVGMAMLWMVIGAGFAGVGTIPFFTSDGAIGLAFGTIAVAVGASIGLGLGVYGLLACATITVRPGSLVIERGVAMFMRRRQMSSGDISDITVRIGGQLNDQPYYEVIAARSTGEPLTLTTLMKDKADAELLAAAFKKSLLGKPS